MDKIKSCPTFFLAWETISLGYTSQLSRSLSVPVSSWTPLPIILPSNHMHQSPIATHTCRSLPGLFKTHTHTRPLRSLDLPRWSTLSVFLWTVYSVSVGLFIRCDSLLPALILACLLDCVCLPPALISACFLIPFVCRLPRPLPVPVYVLAFAPVYLCIYYS